MDDWQYEPLQSLPADALATNSRVMNAMRDGLYRGLARWLRRRFGFRVERAEVLRDLKQFVLVSNHTSHLDAICLLAALPQEQRNRCYSAAAEDHFYTHLAREQCARLVANTFPFRRREDASRSLAACARILERGDSLILFPEGTRSATGQVQPFRRGIGLLVQGMPYPVVPAHIRGAFEALPKGRWRPRSASIRVRFGASMTFTKTPREAGTPLRIAERLQAEVTALAAEPQSTAGVRP